MFKSFTTSQTKPTSYREEIVARKRLYRPYVTDGLVNYYDWANRASRNPEVSDTRLYNLVEGVGGTSTGILLNGPSYTTNERLIHDRHDGTNDITRFATDITGGGITVEMVARIRTNANGEMLYVANRNNYDIYKVNGIGFNTYAGNVWGITSARMTELNLVGTSDSNWAYYTFFFPDNKDITLHAKMYINGRQETLSDVVGSSSGQARSLNAWQVIGGDNPDLVRGVNYAIQADYAELRIYNRELSAREVAYNYGVAKSRKGV